MGRTISRIIGGVVPDFISWEWQTSRRARAGQARLHTERDQQDADHALQHPCRSGAPVSVPITWDELDDPELRSDGWTIRTIGARLAAAGDPLAPLIRRQQLLPDLS